MSPPSTPVSPRPTTTAGSEVRWPFGQTWTFTRAATQDRTGDRSQETTFTVAGCVFWPEGIAGSTRAETEADFARNTTTSHANLAVPDTEDVRSSDRATSPTGEKFLLIGQPRWQLPHALTGWQAGYQIFRIEGVR